ncbi:MAG: glycosyl hydrolase [Polyangiaceae bacterium]|nr:glycosyl hydrolase [Polyangiaceae bacterium]
MLSALGAAAVACSSCPGQKGPDAAPVAPPVDALAGAVVIYDGKLEGDWRESGSAVRDPGTGPASMHFGPESEWRFSRPGLGGSFGALTFRVREPAGEGEFLAVQLGSSQSRTFPIVKLNPDHRTEVGDGWFQVVVPIAQLNPKELPFDSVVIRPFRPIGLDTVQFDRIGLTPALSPVAALLAGAPAAATVAPAAAPSRGVRARVQCDVKPTRISPYIYGIAYGEKDWPALGVTARRWGGNASSRYNWEIHAANRSQDWFFENRPEVHYDEYLAANAAHEVASAVVVPMIGWVAKDATSYSFPVSVFGAQQKTEPGNPDVGNGVDPSGNKIAPGPPARTSIAAPPEWVKHWIAAIRANDAKTGKKSVYEYILDNEPTIWNTTHRDVHPEPLGYDELLDRTLRYGAAVRAAQPDALIAGPAEWGWSGYFFSARDLDGKPATHADRRAHGDVPLVEWYLQQLHHHEQKTGERILDLFDLHYYPQGNGVGSSDGGDRATQLLRLRSTRSLWDPTYVDESWIHDTVRLLPRMKGWVDKNYPGLGLSIGEWNFGGERDITGALATAETLGRFAQFGVTSAFYWTAPAAGAPAAFGFLAYRNFDGQGGRFLDQYVPTTATGDASFFASRDADGKHVVVVALNLGPDEPLAADIDVGTCGAIASARSYVYARGNTSFTPSEVTPATGDTGAVIAHALPPWSITVFDLRLREHPAPPAR